MNDTPEEGMRVHVHSADKKKDLGLGTIEKVEPLLIEEPGLTITSSYPSRIVLDNGEVTNGFNCWWISVEGIEEIEKKTDNVKNKNLFKAHENYNNYAKK